MSRLAPYWKTITALIGAAATIATIYALPYPWVPALISVATALGVYTVRNQQHPAATATDPMRSRP